LISAVKDPAAAVGAAPGATAAALAAVASAKAASAKETLEQTFQAQQQRRRRVLPAHRHHPPLVGETLRLKDNVGRMLDLTVFLLREGARRTSKWDDG